MADMPAFLTEALTNLPPEERENLRGAYDTARDIYGDERSPAGQTRIEQVADIAKLLLPFHPDAKTLIATFLQFADAAEHLPRIAERFGKGVSGTIASLSILAKGCGTNMACSPEKLRRMVFTLSSDIHVLIICLHNHWHALKNSHRLPEEHRRALAHQALEVFAPICARLGIFSLKHELETLGFLILHPDEAEQMGEKFREIHEQLGPFLSESIETLRRLLKEEGKRMEIFGREKHAASIFRKVRDKSLDDLREIYDLFGIRILVETVEDCYRALGIIHRNCRPIIHRIKDYIAVPKPNGYRSLHTTILGLSGKDPTMPVEVQIRTFGMEDEAEYGVAAHWNYKEGGTREPAASRAWRERMKVLRQLPVSAGQHEEFNDILREEFSDRIFVLTPKGDPVELPQGATPLDFAFRIHTEVGLSFRGAKINGRIATIDQELENGDTVEILKWKEPRPSEQWIRLIRTKDARQKLRAHFRSSASAREAA